MKIIISSIALCIFLQSLSGQFYLLPDQAYSSNSQISETDFHCNSLNKQAKLYFQKGIENLSVSPYASVIFFQASINSDSLFCDAYEYLSIAYIKVHENDSAFDAIEKALELNKGLFALNLKGEYLLRKGNTYEALEYFEDLSMNQPDNFYWCYHKTRALLLLDSLKHANNEIGKLNYKLNQSGMNTKPGIYLWGVLYFKQRQYDDAIKQFSLLKSMYQNDAEYNYFLGMTYYRIGNAKSLAKQYLTKAFKKGYKIDNKILTDLNIGL